MAVIVRRIRRLRYVDRPTFDRRIFRDRTNPLDIYSEAEVHDRYRFYPQTILYLCELLDLEKTTRRSCPLPPLMVVLVSLHFFGTNTHQLVTASVHGVSRASVSRAVKLFTDCLCTVLDQFVELPMGNGLKETQRQFYAIAGFPNVVGAIDGTQVRIQAPSLNEADYVNRKGFHSINVQMICDAKFRITNVVAKWPGSVHDARIFRDSIQEKFERGEVDGLLLGDSGYPCRKYLLTPYLSPQTPVQERYNTALCKSRVLIEQTFGFIKRRFACLSYGLRMKPNRCVKVIAACVVLHNIGIDRGDTLARTCEDPEEADIHLYEGPGTGNHYRDFIANAFFN